ncbi:hypothetical protein [Streptomyces sp. NPDC048309]|uniref:hypothetical protein n=1 Tax=Streptomyces sp. NPDC048309 TaxID=3154618 RepID=UPI00340F2152
MDSDYVTNCPKELMENTADIERGTSIVVTGGKYVMFIGKGVLRGMKGRTRSSASVLRGQQVRDVDQGRFCSPHA